MTLVWISGASARIGAALAATVPFPGTRVIDISRRGGAARGIWSLLGHRLENGAVLDLGDLGADE